MLILRCALLLLIASGRAAAEEPARGSTSVRVNAAIGQIYLDEGFPDHDEVGGSVRVFLSMRTAVQAELSSFLSNVAGLPNEFGYTVYASALRLIGTLDRPVQPYVVGGLNIRSGGIGNTAVWPYGGVGFRIPFHRRLSADLEVGGPLLRVSGALGFELR